MTLLPPPLPMGVVINSLTIITIILSHVTIAIVAGTIANMSHTKTSGTFAVTVQSDTDLLKRINSSWNTVHIHCNKNQCATESTKGLHNLKHNK
jgi:hypothetical protein